MLITLAYNSSTVLPDSPIMKKLIKFYAAATLCYYLYIVTWITLPTCRYYFNYLDIPVPPHIDSSLVTPVHSLAIVILLLLCNYLLLLFLILVFFRYYFKFLINCIVSKGHFTVRSRPIGFVICNVLLWNHTVFIWTTIALPITELL